MLFVVLTDKDYKMSNKIDLDNMSFANLKANFDEIILHNIQWYRRRSFWNKILYYLINFLIVLIPATILNINSNDSYKGYIPSLLIISLLLTTLNLTLNPLNTWSKFKKNEIHLNSLLYRFRTDICDISGDIEGKKILKLYIVELENTMIRVASEFFMSIEDGETNPNKNT